jgi:quercetin dioxygenase-like cupin family protein
MKEDVMAKPAAEVAPHVYKVAFENERVRLLEVTMAPGAESALHSHPDYLVYALSDGKVKLAGPLGEGAEVDIRKGDTMWRDAEEHSAVNVGTAALRALFVELK